MLLAPQTCALQAPQFSFYVYSDGLCAFPRGRACDYFPFLEWPSMVVSFWATWFLLFRKILVHMQIPARGMKLWHTVRHVLLAMSFCAYITCFRICVSQTKGHNARRRGNHDWGGPQRTVWHQKIRFRSTRTYSAHETGVAHSGDYGLLVILDCTVSGWEPESALARPTRTMRSTSQLSMCGVSALVRS